MRVFSVMLEHIYKEFPNLADLVKQYLIVLLQATTISKHPVKSTDGKTTLEMDAWVDVDYFNFFLKTKYLPVEYKLPHKKFTEHQQKQLDSYLQEAYVLLEFNAIRNILQCYGQPSSNLLI
jgi:hypothetical protein